MKLKLFSILCFIQFSTSTVDNDFLTMTPYPFLQKYCTYQQLGHLGLSSYEIFFINYDTLIPDQTLVNYYISEYKCNIAKILQRKVIKLTKLEIRLPATYEPITNIANELQQYIYSIKSLVAIHPTFETVVVIVNTNSPMNPYIETILNELLKRISFKSIQVLAEIHNPEFLDVLLLKDVKKLSVLNLQFEFYRNSLLLKNIIDLEILYDEDIALRETTLPYSLPNLRTLKIPPFANVFVLLNSRYNIKKLKVVEGHFSIWKMLSASQFLSNLEALNIYSSSPINDQFDTILPILIDLRPTLKNFSIRLDTIVDTSKTFLLNTLLKDNKVIESLTVNSMWDPSSFKYLKNAIGLKRFEFIGRFMNDIAFNELISFIKKHKSLTHIILNECAYYEDVDGLNLYRFGRIMKAVGVNPSIREIFISFRMNIENDSIDEVYSELSRSAKDLSDRELSINGFPVKQFVNDLLNAKDRPASEIMDEQVLIFGSPAS